MKASAIRVAFVAPLMGYTLWSLASAAPAVSLAGIAALGVSSAPLLSGIARRPTAWPNLTWLALGAAIVLSYRAGSSDWNSIGVPLTVGLVVTSPIAVFGVLLVGRRSMPISLLVSTLALAVSAFDLAVVRQLRVIGAGPFDVAGWSVALRTVGSAQLVSLGASAFGAAPGSPLGYLGDPVADVLGLFVVLGLLLGLILPSTRTPQLIEERGSHPFGSLRPHPAVPGPAAPSHAIGPGASVLPETAYQMTGVASLVAALVAVLLFQVATTDDAFPDVGAMAVAVVAVVVTLIFLADRGASQATLTGPAPQTRPFVSPRRGSVRAPAWPPTPRTRHGSGSSGR